MADFDPTTGAFVVPWWGAIAILALVAGLAVLAMLRAGGGHALSVIAQLAAVFAIGLIGWTVLDRMNRNERADERRILEARAQDLVARAMAPGSALGCLDPVAADAFDEPCEKALFASPESVSGAISFVSSRLALLSDMIDYEVGNPGKVDEAILNLRRVLERDRYGFVAHILATRDSCTEERCETFELFGDTGRIVSNLQGHSFETRLERATTAWAGKQPQTVAAPPGATTPNAAVAVPGVPAATSSVNFPTASSIPPVSIMNNEPGMAGQNGVEDSKPEPKEAKPAARKPAEKPAPRRVQGSGSSGGAPQGTAPQSAAPMPITPTADAAAARAP